jgi:aryl-alcohol dehydrogenase-like predicted oxidoreductase
MEFRHLGQSGLLVSEISYGNWVTHGSQVEEDAANACVHAALDLGITTFDTADVYAGTKAEAILGRALAGQRREGLEILTKVYWPTGPGRNDRGLSRKHIMESINGSLRRLQTVYVQPAAVLHAVAGHRTRDRAGVRGTGHRPDRLLPDRPGRAVR